jgi:microcystin degradation protein MlrC
MDDQLFDAFLDELRADLASGHWDAVYLSLHGALATTRRRTPDLDVLRLVREMVNTKPIGASFDMHANMAPRIAGIANVAAGYKTLPHVDMFEVGEKVLGMLVATVEKRIRPVGVVRRVNRIIHSHNMRTADGPMKDLEEIARDLTRGPILDVTPFGGFPWADTPYTGASVMVYADDDALAAQAAADAMVDAMRRKAPEFDVERPGPEDGLRQALALGTGPVAVVECADNIYSGGIADTPGLLRALLDMAPTEPCVFAFFFDPDTVARAHAAGIGGRVRGSLGGRITDIFGPPVAVDAEVVRLTDGRFVNRGPMLRGVETRLGRTAVLRVGQVDIIVTERREPVNDLGYMELHGIDLTQARLLCIKAKNHFRAAYGPVCRGFVEVDTPGPAAVDLTRLPFRYAQLADFVSPS